MYNIDDLHDFSLLVFFYDTRPRYDCPKVTNVLFGHMCVRPPYICIYNLAFIRRYRLKTNFWCKQVIFYFLISIVPDTQQAVWRQSCHLNVCYATLFSSDPLGISHIYIKYFQVLEFKFHLLFFLNIYLKEIILCV